MSILVLGGAGYIGSHAVYQLIDRGEHVVVVDSLETGHQEAIPLKLLFIKGISEISIFYVASLQKNRLMPLFILQPIHSLGNPWKTRLNTLITTFTVRRCCSRPW